MLIDQDISTPRAMVRVMIIRHGETAENVAMAEALHAYSIGKASNKEAHAMMRDHYKTESPDQGNTSRQTDVDSPLTKVGEEMAQRVGIFFAPLLQDLARRGKLHAFTSPMCRNLQVEYDKSCAFTFILLYSSL